MQHSAFIVFLSCSLPALSCTPTSEITIDLDHSLSSCLRCPGDQVGHRGQVKTNDKIKALCADGSLKDPERSFGKHAALMP